MKHTFTLLIFVLALVFIANAQTPKMTSVYTSFKTDCKNALKSVDEGQDMSLVCKGYGGYKVDVSYSAWASHISISKKKDNLEVASLGSHAIDFTDSTAKLEWRLANGKPFAVILRIKKYDDKSDGENPYTAKNVIGEFLIVKGLPGFDKIDFEINAKDKNANTKAKRMADKNFK